MKIKSINISILLFLAISSQVLAQDAAKTGQAWTLEQCIEYALKNNIQIQQSQLNTELSQVNLLQSKANLLPSLNANASHSYNYGRTIDRFTNQFATKQVVSQNLSLSSDITVFNGFQNINSIQQNKYALIASRYDVDKMKNDMSLNIARAYLQILFNIELLANANNQMAIISAQVERTKKLVEVGSTARGSLLDIQSQSALEELNVTNAQNQLDISYLTLTQLLNITTTEGFSIVRPDLTIANEALLTSSPGQIFSTAVSNLPEIKSAEYNVKSAEKAVDIAWGGISPRLSFSASYGTGYSGASQRVTTLPKFLGYTPDGRITTTGDTVLSPLFSSAGYEKIPYMDQYKDNVNKSFGFYLTVPLFNRFQTRSAISKARIQKLNALLTVESSKLQLQKNIQQAYADANASLKKYNATQKALDAMQESFKYTEQKFNVGIVNTNDYNDAKNKLINTQSDLLQAKYQYVFNTKVLDFYQGKPLKF
ncbi:MAG: TolC family protein [Bacteroidetes bacterium]|nr:TolC family protein [Bacteroidota bacterium]